MYLPTLSSQTLFILDNTRSINELNIQRKYPKLMHTICDFLSPAKHGEARLLLADSLA